MKVEEFNPIKMLWSDEEVAELLSEIFDNGSLREFAYILILVQDRTDLNYEHILELIAGDYKIKNE